MKYIPIQCQSAVHHIRKGLPYSYDVNIYRGCEHGCVYCYAIYSHDYLNDGQFFHHIYYKDNILEILEKELSSPKWQKGIINMGGVCDSYQPAEKELEIMRGILKLMIQYKNPINISTKSKLILRDLDLIAELSQVAEVSISCSVTCADEKIRQVLEPHGSSSLERMKTLQIIKQNTNAKVGVLMMPIVPYMNDSYDNMKAIYSLASQIGLDFIVPGTLYLRGKTKPYFLNHIKNYNYHLYLQIKQLYQKGSCSQEYKQTIYKKLKRVKEVYPL